MNNMLTLDNLNEFYRKVEAGEVPTEEIHRAALVKLTILEHWQREIEKVVREIKGILRRP